MRQYELRQIEQEILANKGVVTSSDLGVLLDTNNPQKRKYLIKLCVENGLIERFSRGVYVSPGFSPDVLSQKIYPNSYLSLGTVLAKHLVIGSVPAKTFYSVKLGRSREFSNGVIRLKYFGISKDYFESWEVKNGIRYATKEKAFIDLMYFYHKGFRPSVNIYSDLNLRILDVQSISRLLYKYKNKKFVAFVEGVLSGN